MIFKQSHDDRGSNVIWQIGNNLDRTPLIFFQCKLADVYFEDVVVDDCHIIPIFQSVVQNRKQCFINLNCCHFPCCFSQILCHGSDSRSNLQHKIILSNLCRSDDLIQYMRIYQEILSEFFLKHKVILLKHRDRILRISKCWFFHLHTSFSTF